MTEHWADEEFANYVRRLQWRYGKAIKLLAQAKNLVGTPNNKRFHKEVDSLLRLHIKAALT